MNCRDCGELLSAYNDGELSQAQRESVENHLSGCEKCRRLSEDFRLAERSLRQLPDVPVRDSLAGIVMERVGNIPVSDRGSLLLRLRPAVIIIAAVILAAFLFGGFYRGGDSLEVRAAAILRDSPEVAAALQGEQMVDVEVTTKWVDEEGNILTALVRTETRYFAAGLDMENREIVEIVPVELPDIPEGFVETLRETVLAHTGVHELLARGGAITGIEPEYGFLMVPDYSSSGQYPDYKMVPFLRGVADIEIGGERWEALITLPGDGIEETVILVEKGPESDTNVTAVHNVLYNFAVPVMLLLAVFLLFDVLYRKNPTGRIVAGAVVLYAAVAFYLAGFGWPAGEATRQGLVMGLAFSSVLMGMAVIRTHGVWRWPAVSGTVIGTAGFVWAVVQLFS